MNLKPLFNQVIIKPIIEEVKTSGIILPETMNKQSNKGEVVALGEDCKSKIVVGDKVVFKKYLQVEIVNDCIILNENDILAVIL